MKEKKFSGYLMAVLCFAFIFVNMGCLNSLGVFSPSLVQETGYSRYQISLMFTFAGASAALTGMFITPKALKKLGEKKCMLFATILTAAHFLVYSSVSRLFLLYIGAVMGGMAIGIGLYAACCAIVGHWFIKNRLVMLSIVSAGSPIGSAFINMFAGRSIMSVGYRNTYRILAVFALIVGIVIIALVRNRPEDMGQSPLGEAGAEDPHASEELKEGITFREARKSGAFYLAFAGAVLASIAWTGVNMYLMTLLSSNYGLPLDVATRYDALLRVCIAAFLFIGGKLADRYGIRKYVFLVGILLSAGLLIIVLTGSTLIALPVLLVLVMIIISVGGSHGNANNQLIANSVFGRKDFTTIQAYLVSGGNTGIALSAIVAGPFIGADGSTLGCFRLFLVCSVLWLVLIQIAIGRSPYSKEKEKQ